MWLNTETEVTQDLRPQSVAQTDVLEPDHVPLRRAAANVHRPVSPRVNPYIATPTALESATLANTTALRRPLGRRAMSSAALGFPLVSGPLTNGLLACRRLLSGANRR